LTKDNIVTKTVGALHVVYLSIIFTGVIVWLISYIFVGSNYAGSLLNFAATLSSILLAVIAIIITLIDVAGQRNNIFDVKSSIEELKIVSNDIAKIVEEFENRNQLRNDEMLTIISQFNETNANHSKKFDDITVKLDKISLTGEPKSDIEEIKREITTMKDKMKKPYLTTQTENPSLATYFKDFKIDPSNGNALYHINNGELIKNYAKE